MPRGEIFALEGLLLQGRIYPVLRVDGGGEWRLDSTKSCRHLYGRRVAVTGVRDGFDMLAVTRIAAL